jgi:hypothetical protein
LFNSVLISAGMSEVDPGGKPSKSRIETPRVAMTNQTPKEIENSLVNFFV